MNAMNSSSSQIKVQLILPQEKISFNDKLKGFWQLVHADKPIGILLLLWPTLWALWIAGDGSPDWYVTLVFILCTVLIHSAAYAIDDFADRYIDSRVMRTHHRPIATGVIKPKEAIAVFVGLSLLAFMLVLTLNLITVLMSFVALGLAAAFPFVKRYTQLPQAFLGIASGWAVPMVFTAIQETVLPVTWVLLVATIIWVLIYDTEYAMVNRDDDLKADVKSAAILFGRNDVYFIGVLQLTMLGLLLWAGVLTERSWFYFIGTALSVVFFVRQQKLMHHDRKVGAFAAFQNNNCFGMTVFIILLIDYFITSG